MKNKTRSTRKVKLGRHMSLGKKAFIMSFLVDFWAYITFVIVVIVFSIIFKYSAEARLQELEDTKDVVYGNYFSNVYLRSPVVVGGESMTMAELISMFDYNQTLEKENPKHETSYLELLVNDNYFFYGKRDNPMWTGIATITDEFIDDNFDSDKCYVLAIAGNGFEYSRFGPGCPIGKAFPIDKLLPEVGIPKETFVTYLPSVDPRDDPIKIYVIYDLRRLFDLYSSEDYGDWFYWQMKAANRFCYAHQTIANCGAMWT